ncbi:hypothetical protein ES708_33397 [subsurface metagenome]
MVKEMDKEELVGQFLCGWVSPFGIAKLEAGTGKTLAVERYMRTYLRALTLPELEFEFKYAECNADVSPTIHFKINQASVGYDKYMARHGAKVA